MRKSPGVTLIEMLFGMAIVAILAGLAAPGFLQSLRASAVRAGTYELLAGLHQTRGTSIVEAAPAMLCPSDPAGNCVPAGTSASYWNWSVESAGRPPREEPFVLPAGVITRASRSPVRFWPHALSASTATLTICDLQGIAAPRAIVVNVSGRARVAAAAESACG